MFSLCALWLNTALIEQGTSKVWNGNTRIRIKIEWERCDEPSLCKVYLMSFDIKWKNAGTSYSLIKIFEEEFNKVESKNSSKS